MCMCVLDMMGNSSAARTAYPSGALGVHPLFLVGFVLLDL